MNKKIPKKERLVEEIKKVLRARIKVESQEELCKLVLNELKKENKNFTLSPHRVKRLALTIPEIEIKAKTKKMPRISKIDKCPICKSMIVPLKGKNLLNKEILIGYKCVNCSYSSDLEAFMPMKYIFILKQRQKNLL